MTGARDRRPALLAALLSSFAFAFALAGCGSAEPEEGAREPIRGEAVGTQFRTAAQCGACHTEIYEEWKASMHGQAMADPLFLEFSPPDPEECIRCHAPVPLREVDFETPIARLDRREDAVSCLTCHETREGVAGPTAGLSGPCRPVADRDQRNPVKMCFGCHNQHDTGTEWLSGPYSPHAPSPRRVEEKSCLDCHMPEVERAVVEGGAVRRGRRHTWPGGHDLAQLRRAAEVDAEVEPLPGGGIRVRTWVTNVGAGHNIPTDARHRSLDVYVKVWDADGRVVLDPLDPVQQARARAATYRKFYRNSGIRDTQIPPLARVSELEAERGYVDLPEVREGRGEVWLVYRLTPADVLEEASLSAPEDLVLYRARVVDRAEFTFGP